MSGKLVLALPSKGRLMDQCNAALAKAGFTVSKSGPARGYKGEIAEMPEVEVNFVSSSEIAQFLKTGSAHLGITGEDLIRETIADADQRVEFLQPCGFGRADVVVAVPACWLDVRRLSDLEDGARLSPHTGRQVRVATKHEHGAALLHPPWRHRLPHRREPGGDRGAPAAGLAELIVDITTTGATLKATLEGAGRRRHPPVAGQPDRLQRRPGPRISTAWRAPSPPGSRLRSDVIPEFAAANDPEPEPRRDPVAPGSGLEPALRQG
jgi:ATP phosphoribosyltransferase